MIRAKSLLEEIRDVAVLSVVAVIAIILSPIWVSLLTVNYMVHKYVLDLENWRE